METIKLYYTTFEGGWWLESELEVSPSTYKEVIDSYVAINQPTAESMLDKWKYFGLTKYKLFVDIQNINTSKELFRELHRYLIIHYE